MLTIGLEVLSILLLAHGLDEVRGYEAGSYLDETSASRQSHCPISLRRRQTEPLAPLKSTLGAARQLHGQLRLRQLRLLESFCPPPPFMPPSYRILFLKPLGSPLADRHLVAALLPSASWSTCSSCLLLSLAVLQALSLHLLRPLLSSAIADLDTVRRSSAGTEAGCIFVRLDARQDSDAILDATRSVLVTVGDQVLVRRAFL